MIGVSRTALSVWKSKDPNFAKAMEKERAEGARECIEVGLRKLAQGAESASSTEKYIYYKEGADGQRVPVEKTIKLSTHAPSEKAIEILSRKYHKEFAKQDGGKSLNIALIDQGFNMRQLKESRQNPIDVGAVVDAEYTRLEVSEVAAGPESDAEVPPGSGAEGE